MKCVTLVFTCMALLVTGCGLTKGKAIAETGIAHFHQLYNEEKYNDIWSEADTKYQSGITKDKSEEIMSAVQRKLGKVTSSSNTRWNVNTFNLTTTVMMAQKTVFEKGEGSESFTFVIKGEKAILVKYEIQSVDLIIK